MKLASKKKQVLVVSVKHGNLLYSSVVSAYGCFVGNGSPTSHKRSAGEEMGSHNTCWSCLFYCCEKDERK